MTRVRAVWFGLVISWTDKINHKYKIKDALSAYLGPQQFGELYQIIESIEKGKRSFLGSRIISSDIDKIPLCIRAQLQFLSRVYTFIQKMN